MPGFLKLLLSGSVCVCAYMYMALAINIPDECGLSNEAYCELLSKNSKVMLYLPFLSQ